MKEHMDLPITYLKCEIRILLIKIEFIFGTYFNTLYHLWPIGTPVSHAISHEQNAVQVKLFLRSNKVLIGSSKMWKRHTWTGQFLMGLEGINYFPWQNINFLTLLLLVGSLWTNTGRLKWFSRHQCWIWDVFRDFDPH